MVSDANALTAACTFDISKAAGMPLPATSAMHSAALVSLEFQHVKVIAAHSASRTPRRRDSASFDLRNLAGQQPPLNASGFD